MRLSPREEAKLLLHQVRPPPSDSPLCTADHGAPPPYSASPHEYSYARKYFTLSLGQCKWHTPWPSYGARGHVRGKVTLSGLPQAEIIVVSVRGS